MIAPRESRGFLNNNPGNMDRATGEPWQGEIRDSNDKRLSGFQLHELLAGRFCVFASAEWGIRAMAKNLQAYQRIGHTSVRSMIDMWAPPNENDTSAYIAAVAGRIGRTADEPVSMTDYATARAVVDAIIRVECAGMPYSGSEIEDGLRLAGIVKPAASSSTTKGATIATTATVAQTAVPALQEPLQAIADNLAPMAGTSQVVDHVLLGVKVLLAVIAIGGVLWMLHERFKRASRDRAIDPNPTTVGV